MARDEARHAGFLNRALVAEGIAIDLPSRPFTPPSACWPNWPSSTSPARPLSPAPLPAPWSRCSDTTSRCPATPATPRRRLAQLHWGGGTPNSLTTPETRQLWELIARHFDVEPELEASIEVNPEFLSRDVAMELRALGFNRISFGIQDADPAVQRAVNRVVPAEQLRRVMGWLREAGFSSVNVDLICGLPLQTPARFVGTLELVRELRPDRISLFSFAYQPEQLPLQRRIAADDLPSQRQRLTMLECAHDLLCGSGYEAIGMDHHALGGDSLAATAGQGQLHRNFQGYTTGGELDLLGIGPTAISQFPMLSESARSQGLECGNCGRPAAGGAWPGGGRPGGAGAAPVDQGCDVPLCGHV